MHDIHTATVTITELSNRITAVIEDVLYDARPSRSQIEEALQDVKFLKEVEEIFKKRFST